MGGRGSQSQLGSPWGPHWVLILIMSKHHFMQIKRDTIVNEIPNQTHRPRPWNKNDNPMTAVNKFIKNNKNYKIDYKLNYNHLISSSPGGYIYRKK